MQRPRLSLERRHTHFVRTCAVEMHVHTSQTTSEEPLYTEIGRKNAVAQTGPRTQTHILCEPAQAKRLSRFHKSHLIPKIGKNAAAQSEHPDQSQAFTPTVRTPQCGHTVWGKMLFGHVKSSPPFLNATKYMLT